MCISIPGKVIKKEKQSATVDINGRKVRVNSAAIPEITKGDWVLVYGNLALNKISGQEAKRILKTLAND